MATNLAKYKIAKRILFLTIFSYCNAQPSLPELKRRSIDDAKRAGVADSEYRNYVYNRLSPKGKRHHDRRVTLFIRLKNIMDPFIEQIKFNISLKYAGSFRSNDPEIMGAILTQVTEKNVRNIMYDIGANSSEYTEIYAMMSSFGCSPFSGYYPHPSYCSGE